jgi:arginase
MIRAVRAEVATTLASGAFPLVLGGDCPVLLGCLGGPGLDSPPGLLFVDGHEDAWPPAASATGEAADMELGFALGMTVSGLSSDLQREIPKLDPDAVVVVGPRDDEELAAAGVPSIRDLVEVIAPETASSAPEAVADHAASRLTQWGPWWLHVDLDVLSTESLAAVDYPQPGGLGWDALTRLSRRALSRPDVMGLTVTIFNPDSDPDGSSAARIVRYLADALAGP